MSLPKYAILLTVFLILCIFCLTGGCISSKNTDTSNPVTIPTTTPTPGALPGSPTPAPVISIITTAPVIVNHTSTPTPEIPPTIATPVPQVTKIAAANDPLVDLNFTKVPYGISDCVMKQVFPEIANDPDYGTTNGHAKLIGISDTKWNALYNDYLTGKSPGQSATIFSSTCEGVPLSDSTTWDFAVISARLTPRNAKPSLYSIIISLNSNRKDIAQISTNVTLTLDQPVTISTWVPIKRTEINALGKPTISFNRLTND